MFAVTSLPLTERSAEQALVLDVQEVRGAHARHQRGQLQEVAAVQRQLANLLAGDDARDVAAKDANGRRRRLDVHDLGDIARGQFEVDRELVSDAQGDPRARRFLEARKLGFDLVASDRQILCGVDAGCVCGYGANKTGVFIRGGDSHARQHGLCRVAYRATNGGGRALGVTERRY